MWSIGQMYLRSQEKFEGYSIDIYLSIDVLLYRRGGWGSRGKFDARMENRRHMLRNQECRQWVVYWRDEEIEG